MAKKESKAVVVEQPKEPKVESVSGIPTANGKNIDERMADLLKEHQEMGARPK